MTGLRLQPLRWLLVTEEDTAALLANTPDGGMSFGGGFGHAASTQAVYYRPGSLSEAKRLRGCLRQLGSGFPQTTDVRRLLRDHLPLLRHYQFKEHKDIWYLHNTTVPCFDNPFQRTNWRFFWEMPRGWWSIGIPGTDVIPALQLMPFLNGAYTPEEVCHRIRHLEPAKALLRELADAGALETAEQESFSVADLPEFLFLGHSALALRQESSVVVVDPVGFPSNEILGLPNRPLGALLAAAHAVVFSHHHWDHLHFQTLVRIPRDTLLIVPRVRRPSFANPPVSRYLQHLGFTNVRECSPGDKLKLGKITLRLLPFYGEPFGRHSHFDAFTYYFELGGLTLYGSVDACYDEAGSMDEIIREVAGLGRLDFFLFGASGQRHDPPYIAAGLRYFSDELRDYPELIRYHPDCSDVERWGGWLKPRHLIPYAEFLFQGARVSDVCYSQLPDTVPGLLHRAVSTLAEPAHRRWANEVVGVADRLATPMIMLQPMQGIRTSQ